MKIYLNYGQHPFVLPNEALELMGRPRYVTFLLDQEGRKITIVPLKSHRTDIGMCRIYDGVYQSCGAYAVGGSSEFLSIIRSMAGIDEPALCSVEADFLFLDELKAGQCGLKRGIKVKGLCLVMDLSTARLDFMEEYPVYTWGGYQVCAG